MAYPEQKKQMRTILLFLAAGAVLLLAASCSRQPAFQPVGNVKQLMVAAVAPSADVLFDSVGTIVSVSGVEEIAPKNDEEWANVRNHALVLAESGNLLMMDGRAKDRGDWMKGSQALVAAGVSALKAAEAKDAAALLEAGGALDAVCDQCHTKYWKEAPQ
jgi:hypothetical protein